MLSTTSAGQSPDFKDLNAQTIESTSKMKTLGLIGGTTWHSTIDYYRYINELVIERMGPTTNPPLLMYSLNLDLLVRGDWDGEINQAYLNIALKLQNAGADALLICGNMPHKVCSFVAPRIDIPFIHIADAIGKEANKLKLSNLGLLGTKPTMEEDFITHPLSKQYHIQTFTPDLKNRDKIENLINEELERGIILDASKKYILEEMTKLKSKEIDGVILGCTELPMLIKSNDFDLPLFDTTYLHAKLAVDFILS